MTGTRSSSRIKAQKGARKGPKGADAALTTTTSGGRADSVGSSDATATPSRVIKAAAPAGKRRKTTNTTSDEMETKKPTKRASKKKPLTLEAVTDLPLDILYEIFKHLRPSDLLHLCHANKALRYTLLRSGSKGTWEYSFKAASNPRIPPCLDGGLSFPQYANLIYGKSCRVRDIPYCILRCTDCWLCRFAAVQKMFAACSCFLTSDAKDAYSTSMLLHPS